METLVEIMNSEELAYRIRRHALDMVNSAHASHIGGVLSCADAVAVLYNDVAKYDVSNPEWDERDRIIMSKGHNGAAIYAALAESGFFSAERLNEYGKDGSPFSCHISHKDIPGVEMSTGSLGHGISVACGMALDAKIKGKSHKVFAIVGDGESNEGSFWETIMFAASRNLDNFTVVMDRNGMQAMGFCEDIIDMEPLKDKFEAFGWTVAEVCDGHNHKLLKEAYEAPFNGKPKIIISRTIKGKGVSFMENNLLWHYRDPQGEFYEKAVEELDRRRKTE